MAATPGKRFVAVSLVLTLTLAIAANIVAVRFLDAGVNTLITIFTAIVVGMFLALGLLRPRRPRVSGGFRVEKRELIPEPKIERRQ